MKKISTLVEAFTEANKQLCKSRPAVEPRDIYLAYCALALCTIADKMTDGSVTLIDPEKEKRHE